MTNNISNNPFNYSENQLKEVLNSSLTLFPELQALINNVDSIKELKQTKIIIAAIQTYIPTLRDIPVLNHSLYLECLKTRNRKPYEMPHNDRRIKLSIAVFLYLLGEKDRKIIIENYLKAICEENTWVVPWHEGRLIDIYSADTALLIAEIIVLLKDVLDVQISRQVQETINEKIFLPFIEHTNDSG